MAAIEKRALNLGGGNWASCSFATLDPLGRELSAIAAIGRSGIVRCILAGDTRWVLGQIVGDREPWRLVDDKRVRVGAEAGVVVERGQRGCRRAPGRGGRSVRCANVARISLGPARRTLCKSRGACPASTHRTRQAPRRRESGNRRRRPAPACRNSLIRTFSSFSWHTWSVADGEQARTRGCMASVPSPCPLRTMTQP